LTDGESAIERSVARRVPPETISGARDELAHVFDDAGVE